jgi:hypothetical protein
MIYSTANSDPWGERSWREHAYLPPSTTQKIRGGFGIFPPMTDPAAKEIPGRVEKNELR